MHNLGPLVKNRRQKGYVNTRTRIILAYRSDMHSAKYVYIKSSYKCSNLDTIASTMLKYYWLNFTYISWFIMELYAHRRRILTFYRLNRVLGDTF
jgi:hypothetical protein